MERRGVEPIRNGEEGTWGEGGREGGRGDVNKKGPILLLLLLPPALAACVMMSE